MNPEQIDALKRLDKALSMRDGSADECHEYYCPYNIGMLVDHVKGSILHYPYSMSRSERCTFDEKNNIIHEEDHGIYHGKPDGFDSECPRFLAIDREKGKWDCLCGLDVIARLLGIDSWQLYQDIVDEFKTSKDAYPDILGFAPVWRKLVKR